MICARVCIIYCVLCVGLLYILTVFYLIMYDYVTLYVYLFICTLCLECIVVFFVPDICILECVNVYIVKK